MNAAARPLSAWLFQTGADLQHARMVTYRRMFGLQLRFLPKGTDEPGGKLRELHALMILCSALGIAPGAILFTVNLITL